MPPLRKKAVRRKKADSVTRLLVLAERVTPIFLQFFFHLEHVLNIVHDTALLAQLLFAIRTHLILQTICFEIIQHVTLTHTMALPKFPFVLGFMLD